MVPPRRFLFAVLVIAGLAGCVTAEPPPMPNPSALPRLTEKSVVLLAPPDVTLYELTASGLEKPRADWTEKGRRNVLAAVRAELQRRGGRLVEIDYAAMPPGQQARAVQVDKLHEAVAASMLMHRFFPPLRLPNKSSVYDWSLGPDVAVMREAQGGAGDYLLFIWLEDSFSSGGRVALQILSGAILGVMPPGGVQVGYASLVEVSSGKVAWFGTIAETTGDLRKEDGAAKTVAELLQGLPG